ncbi:MAG: 4-(cytidine 5'-diphospho)-2-C-methyl-D-erythritol kinase [Clostridiales bacterium]|nr:4-(cytidine 5'-diphospho)-2-C-methyl-D-erythritol kinase [Clostridiales bacterium]
MPLILEDKVYCKINLFLKILGTTPDGYHDLFMLMARVGLSDHMKVTVKEEENGNIVVPDIPGLPSENNLCYKAARAYMEASGRCPDTDISLVKYVPSGAGLGGGSADAAFVLKALDSTSDDPLTDERMNGIALSIGADVPFFLLERPAFCEGKGEMLTAVPDLSGVPVLLVKPSEGVNTGECYRLSDETFDPSFDGKAYKDKMISIFGREDLTPLERIKLAAPFMENDLEEPAMKILPKISDIKAAIKSSGSIFSMMTGSGSCVFGIYEDDEALKRATEELKRSPVTSDCFIYATHLV